jgi:hypothetical protein
MHIHFHCCILSRSNEDYQTKFIPPLIFVFIETLSHLRLELNFRENWQRSDHRGEHPDIAKPNLSFFLEFRSIDMMTNLSSFLNLLSIELFRLNPTHESLRSHPVAMYLSWCIFHRHFNCKT